MVWVPRISPGPLLVSSYRQFWPHGSRGHAGPVPGHGPSPCTTIVDIEMFRIIQPQGETATIMPPTCHAVICCRILSLTAGQGSPNCQSTLQEACQGYLQGAVCRLQLDTAVGGVT